MKYVEYIKSLSVNDVKALGTKLYKAVWLSEGEGCGEGEDGEYGFQKIFQLAGCEVTVEEARAALEDVWPGYDDPTEEEFISWALRTWDPEEAERMALEAELKEIMAREKEIRERLKALTKKPDAEAPKSLVGLYMDGGAEAVRAYLESLDIPQLKEVAKAKHNGMYNSSVMRWKDKSRWVEALLTATVSRATAGEVFRDYVD